FSEDSAPTPIRPGNDLEQMAVRIFEVETAAAVVAVDLAGLALSGVGPVIEAARTDAPEHFVEFAFADQERVMLRGDLVIGVVEIERNVIPELDHKERPELRWFRQAEHFSKKGRRLSFVARPNDGVIELHGHARTSLLRGQASTMTSNPPQIIRLPSNGLRLTAGRSSGCVTRLF